MEKFPVRKVDRATKVATEQLGSKPKFWFRDGHQELMFKAEDRGKGEDWAEVISGELCELLGLPHVTYELAALYNDGDYLLPGIVCKNMAPGSQSLIMGNELLLDLDPDYPKQKRFKVQEHSVPAVCRTLNFLEPPLDKLGNAPAGIVSMVDYFIGYVLLDAWIANTDRHHENWAAIRDGKSIRLAPTFDHGASLANILMDSERIDRMQTKDRGRSVAAFAKRARSAFYADKRDKKPLATIDAFCAFAEYSHHAGPAWLERLNSISEEAVFGLLSRVPDDRMSVPCRDFTHQLLCMNRQRLLDLDLNR